MSTPTEQELTRALAPQADGTGPTDDRWAQIVTRGGALRRRDRRRRTAAVLTAAALVIGAVALVQLDRGRRAENRVEFGNQPRAAVDPEAVEHARRAILLADAAAHEAEVSVVEPKSATDIAAARAATDAAGAAWRAAAERRPGGSGGALAAAKASAVTLGALTDLRAMFDQGIGLRLVEQYEHIMVAALETARVEVWDAQSVPAARQLTDAHAIAEAGIEATTMALRPAALAPQPGYNVPEDVRTSLDLGHDRLVAGLAPARVAPVSAVINDYRFEDALFAAATPVGVTDPGLLALAAERRQHLVTIAMETLDEPAALAPVASDPAVVWAVVHDQLALRAARDGEVWTTLVGDAAGLATARAEVDAAVTVAQRSAAALADIHGSGLDCADAVAEQWRSARLRLDPGVSDPLDAARSLSQLSTAQACVLVAAGDLFPSPHDWSRVRVGYGLSSHVSHFSHATALALLRFRGDTGVTAAEMREVTRQSELGYGLFESAGSPEDLPRWRATSDLSPANDFVQSVASGQLISLNGRSWESWRDDLRYRLVNATSVSADMAR